MNQYHRDEPISIIGTGTAGFWESEAPYRADKGGLATLAGETMLLRSRYVLDDRHYKPHLAFEFDDLSAI